MNRAAISLSDFGTIAVGLSAYGRSKDLEYIANGKRQDSNCCYRVTLISQIVCDCAGNSRGKVLPDRVGGFLHGGTLEK